MYRRLGGPPSRTGQVRKISPLTGIVVVVVVVDVFVVV